MAGESIGEKGARSRRQTATIVRTEARRSPAPENKGFTRRRGTPLPAGRLAGVLEGGDWGFWRWGRRRQGFKGLGFRGIGFGVGEKWRRLMEEMRRRKMSTEETRSGTRGWIEEMKSSWEECRDLIRSSSCFRVCFRAAKSSPEVWEASMAERTN